MSTPWAQATSLSTANSSASVPIAIDPMSKMTTVQVSISSPSAAATFYVQATLDGNGAWSAGGFGGLQPQPQPVWGVVGGSSVNGVFESSGATAGSPLGLNSFDGSATFVLLQPISGLRLISSAPGSITSGATVYLRALQSPTA